MDRGEAFFTFRFSAGISIFCSRVASRAPFGRANDHLPGDITQPLRFNLATIVFFAQVTQLWLRAFFLLAHCRLLDRRHQSSLRTSTADTHSRRARSSTPPSVSPTLPSLHTHYRLARSSTQPQCSPYQIQPTHFLPGGTSAPKTPQLILGAHPKGNLSNISNIM